MKKHKIKELEELPDKALQIDEFETDLQDAIRVLEDELMEIEMLLQDALGDSTGKFKDNVKALNESII